MNQAQFGERIEDDPSVCYRHPDRQSWILCQRCGRTICSDCQVLAPVGVQCPNCVQESGGSAPWTSSSTKPGKQRSAARPRAASARPRSGAASGGFVGYVSGLLRPGGESPPLSWVMAAVVVGLWLVGLFTQNLPLLLMGAAPNWALEVWRYATASFVTVADFSLLGIISTALSLFFWLFFAPSMEKTLGRNRFLTIFFAGAMFGAAAQVISGGFAFGLAAGLFALFGAYAVMMWNYPPARNQIIVVMLINLALNLALGGTTLPYILGGLLAGAGASYLLTYYEGRRGTKPSTPYLIMGGVVLLAIAAAVSIHSF